MSERGRHHRLTGRGNRGSPWPLPYPEPRLTRTPAVLCHLCHACRRRPDILPCSMPSSHVPCFAPRTPIPLQVCSTDRVAPQSLGKEVGVVSGTSVRVHARCSALSEARVNEGRFPSPRRVAAASASRRRRRQRRLVARQVSIGGYVVGRRGSRLGLGLGHDIARPAHSPPHPASCRSQARPAPGCRGSCGAANAQPEVGVLNPASCTAGVSGGGGNGGWRFLSWSHLPASLCLSGADGRHKLQRGGRMITLI
ncbi:hypothetical protein E2C01_075731 [Portunus trituberculatus]|uniref:Uncharacterized protein n=1 Tax=Portunus trituberculatus TaxID=210409 RepID=A0A5B7IH26_PORTR|nr:hypothetical protein [Portunus trituberculatus]